jgi:hypothetical protein
MNSDGTPYTQSASSWLAISSTGDVEVDTNKVNTGNFYVKITSNNGAVLNTNTFSVTVSCTTTSNTITEDSGLALS